MTQSATRHRPLSVEEYLRLDDTSPVRHEYVAGTLYALAGASKRHNLIASTILRHLANAAEGGPCRVYMSDVKLRAAEDVVYYPDVMVSCGETETDPLVEHEPCLVVEVTSPSTASIDRREKVVVYKRIPGLRAYVIVDQDRRRVERHWRDEHGAWWHDDVTGQGSVRFPCPELELTLDRIYDGVDVPVDGHEPE